MNKKSLAVLLSILFVVPLFVLPFLNFFIYQVVGSSSVTNSDTFGIFADMSGIEALYKLGGAEPSFFFVTLASIAVVATAAIGAAYVLFALLSLAGSKSKLMEKLTKLFGTILLLASVATLIILILTPIITSSEGVLSAVHKVSLSWLAYLSIGGIIAGLFSLMANDGKKRKK